MAACSASACSRPKPPIDPPHAAATDGADLRDSRRAPRTAPWIIPTRATPGAVAAVIAGSAYSPPQNCRASRHPSPSSPSSSAVGSCTGDAASASAISWSRSRRRTTDAQRRQRPLIDPIPNRLLIELQDRGDLRDRQELVVDLGRATLSAHAGVVVWRRVDCPRCEVPPVNARYITIAKRGRPEAVAFLCLGLQRQDHAYPRPEPHSGPPEKERSSHAIPRLRTAFDSAAEWGVVAISVSAIPRRTQQVDQCLLHITAQQPPPAGYNSQAPALIEHVEPIATGKHRARLPIQTHAYRGDRCALHTASVEHAWPAVRLRISSMPPSVISQLATQTR